MAEGITGENRPKRAAAVLDQALRAWPKSVLLLRGRATLARETRAFGQAEALLNKARELDGGEPATLHELGLLYMSWNRLVEAEAVLLEARKKASRNLSILLALASLYQHLAERLKVRPGKGGRRAARLL